MSKLPAPDTIGKFGRFDDEANEFVITTPQTPRPWENRLWNDQLNIQISNHGTGIAYKRDNNGRFVIFNYKCPNRFLYVFDRSENDLWCPNWFPVGGDLAAYEVRHGLKYTIFKAEKNGVELTWRVTVHHRDAAELWRVEIRNRSGKSKDLLVVPFYQVDLSLSDPYFGHINRYRSFVSAKANCLYVKNSAFVRKAEDDALCFHADRPITKFEMNTEYFLKGFSTLTAPRTVLADEWTNSFIDDDVQPCLAAGFDFKLKRGASSTLNIEIFTADDIRHAEKLCAAYAKEGAFDVSTTKHAKDAARMLSMNNIATDDPSFDRYVNVWIKHQLWHNAEWNRGWGQGFRDAMSDCDMFRAFDPAYVRRRILQAAAHIYADGHTVRSFSPPVEKPYFDGGVWFLNAVCQYIRETGDMSLLDERAPYFKSGETGTILGHLKRTVGFLDKQRGPDNICRMGFGDWNDAVGGIDRAGKGQSIWITMAYIFGLRNSAQLLRVLGDPDAAVYERRASKLAGILNKKFFEGDRYIRAVTDAGRRVGSKKNPEGRLWIEPQGWALFAGVADAAKAEKIVRAMRSELYVPYGVMLLAPPFTKYREDVGRISNDMPGIVENGSNYVQGMLFYTYGLTQADMPDESFDLLCRVLPTNPENPPEKSRLEPFQITNSFQGPASKHPGRAMYSWRTGSAGWFLKTVWDGLVGIVPDFDGVQIRARIPERFGVRIEADRMIRGKLVRFEIAKRGRETKGAAFALRVKNGDKIRYGDLVAGARVLVTV
jgi:cellobiose phosphorylase